MTLSNTEPYKNSSFLPLLWGFFSIHSLLFVIGFALSYKLSGQQPLQAVKLLILREDNQEPIEGMQVDMADSIVGISDANGWVSFNLDASRTQEVVKIVSYFYQTHYLAPSELLKKQKDTLYLKNKIHAIEEVVVYPKEKDRKIQRVVRRATRYMQKHFPPNTILIDAAGYGLDKKEDSIRRFIQTDGLILTRKSRYRIISMFLSAPIEKRYYSLYKYNRARGGTTTKNKRNEKKYTETEGYTRVSDILRVGIPLQPYLSVTPYLRSQYKRYYYQLDSVIQLDGENYYLIHFESKNQGRNRSMYGKMLISQKNYMIPYVTFDLIQKQHIRELPFLKNREPQTIPRGEKTIRLSFATYGKHVFFKYIGMHNQLFSSPSYEITYELKIRDIYPINKKTTIDSLYQAFTQIKYAGFPAPYHKTFWDTYTFLQPSDSLMRKELKNCYGDPLKIYENLDPRTPTWLKEKYVENLRKKYFGR